MALELEIKLKIPDRLTAAKLMKDAKITGFCQEPFQIKMMEAVYYDTPSHKLTQRKWALRLRKENSVHVAACKCNRPEAYTGLVCRDEWQCEAETIEQAIPTLVELGAPGELLTLSEQESFVERCRIVFERKWAVLRLPEGLTCDFSLDDGVIEAGGKREELLEAELEILYGEPKDAQAIAAEWISRYGLTYEFAGKYERALRLIRSRPTA